MRKKFSAPQEKKRLCLERDLRPCYGESNWGARTAASLHKRLANRQRRRAGTDLQQAYGESGAAIERVESKTCWQDLLAHKRRRRKCADAPLGNFIELQMRGGALRAGRKARSRVLNAYFMKQSVEADGATRHKTLELRAPYS